MEKEVKKYKARIFGEVYPLVSDAGDDETFEMIRAVDVVMQEIAEHTGLKDPKKIAVLAALKAEEKRLLLQKRIAEERDQSCKILNMIDRCSVLG